jgi:hypothetical protein
MMKRTLGTLLGTLMVLGLASSASAQLTNTTPTMGFSGTAAQGGNNRLQFALYEIYKTASGEHYGTLILGEQRYRLANLTVALPGKPLPPGIPTPQFGADIYEWEDGEPPYANEIGRFDSDLAFSPVWPRQTWIMQSGGAQSSVFGNWNIHGRFIPKSQRESSSMEDGIQTGF